MEPFWPGLLINGAVVILLWGLVWQGNHQRLDLLQKALEGRVEEAYCRLQHRGLTEDIAEIKSGQEQMCRTLEEIRLRLARENGRLAAEQDRNAEPGIVRRGEE